MKVRPWHKLLVLAVVLFCLLGLGAIIKRSRSASTAEASDHAADADAVPYAAVAPVKRETIATTLSIAGQFIPYQNVELHAKVAGYIKHIYSDGNPRTGGPGG
jgi:multidrug efflux pump subunit AcrA (membrane-fusion protein)